jgi:hypothetical protein
MNRLRLGNLRCHQDVRDVEVALRAGRRADADRLVRQLHMQRVAVCLRIDRHALDAQLLAGANHPHGNLAAIGY